MTSESSETSSLLNRYTDAYSVAKIAIGIGNLIKIVGIVLAVLIFIFAFVLGSFAENQTRGYGNGGAVIITPFIGGLIGFIVGIIFYVIGIIVSALGQILKASLDTAVNGSPFLTSERKAHIMSLTTTNPQVKNSLPSSLPTEKPVETISEKSVKTVYDIRDDWGA